MANNILRTLLVRLGVSVTPTNLVQMKRYNDKLKEIKHTMEEVVLWANRSAIALATVATAGAAAMLGLTVETGKQSVEIERQARLLQLSRKEYQEWLFLAQKFGANSGDLADAFVQLNDAAQRAIAGDKTMTETFRALGIEAERLKGLNSGQIFELMADQAQRATDKQKALSAASQLLGEEAIRQFGPALMQGAEAVRAMRMEAQELGLVLRDDQLAALAAVSTEWTTLQNVLLGLRKTLAAALAPIMLKVLKGATAWVKTNREMLSQGVERWVKRLADALESLHRLVQAVGGWDVVFLNVATGLGLLTLLANLERLKGLLASLKILWAGLGVVGEAAAFAVGLPLSVLVGIIAGLLFFVGLLALGLEDLWIWWRGGNSLLDRNLDLIESIIPAFGAVRRLVWALVEAMIESTKHAGRFGLALLNGLAPALDLIDVLLTPLLRRLNELLDVWKEINKWAGAHIDGITAGINADTVRSQLASQSAAAALQNNLAGSVQGQVSNIANNVSSIDNRSNSNTVHQTNTFAGGAVRDAEGVIGAAFRQARQAFQGGPR